MTDHREHLLDTIQSSVMGDGIAVDGPFGPRRVTYADYTASGRCLSFIENFITQEVIPMYANTHTEASGTGRQTTRFREDARRIILKACGGDERDEVIFCGSGATGAIDKIIGVLNIRIPFDLEKRYNLAAQIPQEERPVVFVGPYEHHSNEVPWRETISEVVVIREDADGMIDLGELERELNCYADRPLKIGSFSAASNVTGVVSDIRGVSRLLHQYGALSFWDFAAAGPYEKIQMNPPEDPEAYIDACFISPHKFIGGPGTPGVLVAKKALFTNTVPNIPGGGTVAYVNPEEHRYLSDPAHREEGGTPAIIESIRAGLVFQLKEAVGTDLIREREKAFISKAIASWSANPNIEILGKPNAERLSIVSFVVKHTGKYLHHNFVVSLLNDLLGVQARGGCSCAGPYGHRLLGINLDTSRAFEQVIVGGCEGIKPGWVRINFNYFISEEIFEFLVEAVNWVASNGWYFLPLYSFDPVTALWSYNKDYSVTTMRLSDISYRCGYLQFRSRQLREPVESLNEYLEDAEVIRVKSMEAYKKRNSIYRMPALMDEHFETLRWFHLPWEVLDELGGYPIVAREDGDDLAPLPGFNVQLDARLMHYANAVMDARNKGMDGAALMEYVRSMKDMLKITDDQHQVVLHLAAKGAGELSA